MSYYKFYRPLFQPFLKAWDSVFIEEKPATRVIEAIFKNHRKWGSHDRRLFAETFYNIIKHRILLEKTLSSITGDLNNSLESLLIFYLLIQKHEIGVSELLENSSYKKIQKQVTFCKIPNLETLTKTEDLPLDQKYSIPEKLHQICQEEIPKSDLEKYYSETQKRAPLFLRVNSFKSTVQNLAVSLEQEGFSTQIIDNKCLKVLKNTHVLQTQNFKRGEFEIQDGGSQCIAPFLLPQSQHLVVDACAGAGGKSLHLSNLMENKGHIVALDIYQWKLDELHRRAQRNKCHNIETRLIKNSKEIEKLKNKVDRLLLDVPCTGSGVFRRNPDAKYRWNRNTFEKIQSLQKEILQSYAHMLKSGGIMVYSTCSVLYSENQKQVQIFLDQNLGYVLEDEVFIAVGENDFDGYYMARIKKS